MTRLAVFLQKERVTRQGVAYNVQLIKKTTMSKSQTVFEDGAVVLMKMTIFASRRCMVDSSRPRHPY